MKLLDPEKEEKIIKSVIGIAGKCGLTGVNMSDVSKEAGMSVGTLYTYFKGKDELLKVAYNRTVKQITYKMYEKFDVEKPVKESLFIMFRHVLEYRIRNYDETVLIDQYLQSKYVQLNPSKYQREFRERNQPLHTLMQKGISEGVCKPIDESLLINFFNGCVRSFSNAIVQQMIPYDKNIVLTYFEMIWNGLEL